MPFVLPGWKILFSLLIVYYREILSSRRMKGGYIFVPRRGVLFKNEDKKDLPWAFNNLLTY